MPEESTAFWRERAWDFMRENPEVYNEFLRRCSLAKVMQHRQKLGAKTIWEAMRWDFVVGRSCTEVYALNNNFTRTFAERVMEENPDDFGGFFDLRNRTDGGTKAS